ncbi:PREDICTED: GDSL esterase/lipase At1g71250 isoform X2 [Tarenaya hassleriana]|uniref:GDSL esterase/lipase At1g71250 isoform X2 n=1 Tax=Tarenaya hassleriana TaxID=28532 RepID=UPI00053C90D4|nr:PREDICTED: GDSL esterase/lipase At1g71250 isoform X2 [Tarenaya hassleriana]
MKKEWEGWGLAVVVTAGVVLGHSEWVAGQGRVSALFVLGDSLVDVGNNNYLASIARANYFPYGDLLGVSSPPAFADPNTSGIRILGGVNYASAAAGILEETGQHYGARYSLSQQVLNLETTLNQLRGMLSPANFTDYLAKAIVVLVFGSNDYINNYLMPDLYSSSFTYTPPAFANLLLNRYARQLLALNSLGLRKLFIAGIGPLGCIPNQRASGRAPLGRCLDSVNQMLGTFNEGLRSLVDQLNQRSQGAIFAYGNTYGAVGDILNNPTAYGFSVIDRACCGIGRNQGQITCMPLQYPCPNRTQYVFWDAFHPTQTVNSILARRAFYGPPSDSYPVNVQQMSLLH